MQRPAAAFARSVLHKALYYLVQVHMQDNECVISITSTTENTKKQIVAD